MVIGIIYIPFNHLFKIEFNLLELIQLTRSSRELDKKQFV